MTELTFSAGQRVTLDLRDCRGDVRVEDGEAETVKVTTTGAAAPFVLRDGDTFRIRLEAGGTVAVPPEVPVEVIVPDAVRLRLARHGETEVIRQEPAGAGGGATSGVAGASGGTGGPAGREDPLPVDLSEFVRSMSEQTRRIFDQMTEKVRQGGFDASEATDEVARRLDEAAERIDEQVQRVAARVEREVEKAFGVAERASRRAEDRHRHDAGRQQHAEERARHQAERAAARAGRMGERAGERAERRAGRGRWWFTDKLEQAVREATAGAGHGAGGAWSSSTSSTSSASTANGRQGATATASRPAASPEERRVILDMLAQGTISAEQAARLLDALGT
jgi:hypothetical protein